MLLGSPHLEEKWIGGVVDLDLLSCFPKNGQESLEGSVAIELSKCATMEEREEKWLHRKKWGRSPFYRGHKNVAVGGKTSAAGSPAWGQPAPRPGRDRTAQQAAKEKKRQEARPAPGLGPAWARRWAGWPPEAPGFEPATAQPGARVRPAAQPKHPA